MKKFCTEFSQFWSGQMNFSVIWRFLHIARELIRISVCKKKPVIIMVKIFCATVRNSVFRATIRA